MESILNLVGLFFAVAIMLFIGTQILGNDSLSDCTDLKGYVSSGSDDTAKYPDGTWAGQCYQISQSTMQAYSLLGVILIVVAAVTILLLIRLL